MKYWYLSLILITQILFSSCKKKKAVVDKTIPFITLQSPMPLDTIHLSVTSSILTQFTVIDNVLLDKLSIRMYNSSNVLVYVDVPNVKGLQSYSFSNAFVPSGIAGVMPYKILITAIDASDNELLRTIEFFVTP